MKRNKRRGWRRLLRQIRLPLCAFAVLGVLALTGSWILRATMLDNAYETHTALARSCAAEERGNLNVYETLLSFGSSALEKRLEDGESREEIGAFLDMYFTRVDSVLGRGVVDPYVVLDGEILAANPWEGDDAYDYENTPWYQQAMAAEDIRVATDLRPPSPRPVYRARRRSQGQTAPPARCRCLRPLRRLRRQRTSGAAPSVCRR